MIILALLASLGFFLSLASYLATFGGIDPHTSIPGVDLLHIGIFLVLVLAIILQERNAERPVSWQHTFGHAPRWMRWLPLICLVHAFLNVAAFELVCGRGGPSREPDGSYVISNHGRVIRTINAEEYHRARRYEFRLFCSWWMVAYSFVLVMLISGINRRKRELSHHRWDLRRDSEIID